MQAFISQQSLSNDSIAPIPIDCEFYKYCNKLRTQRQIGTVHCDCFVQELCSSAVQQQPQKCLKFTSRSY